MTTQKPNSGQRGQALVEFALILPILLLITLGIIDFGRVLFVFADTTTAMKDAARNAEILGFNAGAPTYADCPKIIGRADDARFVDIAFLEVYYWDTTDPADDGLTPADTTDDTTMINSAHYSCNNEVTTGLTQVNSSVMSNGDVMRVVMRGRVPFMTPFLSNVFAGGITLEFYGQRTVVTSLTLGSTQGIDKDFDGLDDRWEFMWWGCWDKDDDTKLWLVEDIVNPGQWLHADISTWEDWTVTDVPSGGTTTGASWQDKCDIRTVKDADGNDADIPKNINTKAYNAISDPDGDGCNNGCEEVRNGNPITATDSDGDGLDDGAEASTYLTNPSGGDLIDCSQLDPVTQLPVAGQDGVPDGYDTDCDGVPDGVEVGIIEPNNPGLNYPYMASIGNFTVLGNPYRPTQARAIDLVLPAGYDGVDSDGDGLTDHEEYYGADPCGGPEASGRPIEGTPTDCHADWQYASPFFPTNEYLTNPSQEDFNPADGAADGLDTDNDGLGDRWEIIGLREAGAATPCSNGQYHTVINKNLTVICFTWVTRPDDADTDGDGLTDGEEVEGTRNPYLTYSTSQPGRTDPTDNNTDNDGFTDGEELFSHVPPFSPPLNPLEDDSDDDGLRDEVEVGLTSDPFDVNSDGIPPLDYDELYGDETLDPGEICYLTDGAEVNDYGTHPDRMDTEPDGLSDCAEIFIYNTDPADDDTDDDGDTDGAEIDCGADPHDPLVDCDSGSLADTDFDGLPDWWENNHLGDLTQDGNDDPDFDGCNNLCEYQQGTIPFSTAFDPITPTQLDSWDTDNDGLSDGEELPDSSPTDYDTDGDGLNDLQERNCGSNPRNPYTDDDGLTDYEECVGVVIGGVTYTSDPANPDSDFDLLFDHFEVAPHSSMLPYRADRAEHGDPWDLHDWGSTDPNNPNSDGDGWTDFEEVISYGADGANPNDPDSDGDGIQDDIEGTVSFTEFSGFFNEGGPNADGWDTDDDGVSDGDEWYNPSYTNIDNGQPFDGYHITIEICNLPPINKTIITLNPNYTHSGDSDSLSDGEWITYGTDPSLSDTDGDGIADDIEIANGTDPLCGDGTTPTTDTDGDGINDTDELGGYDVGGLWTVTSDPLDADSDGDGLTDGEEDAGYTLTSPITCTNCGGLTYPEMTIYTNPTDVDSNSDLVEDGYDTDNDGLSDLEELQGQTFWNNCSSGNITVITHPLVDDTDGDGLLDGIEVANNMDPTDGNCGPSAVVGKVDATLETILNMYWGNDPSTAGMSQNDAETAALSYALSNGYPIDNTDRTIIVFLRPLATSANCSSQTNLTGLISTVGGTGAFLGGPTQVNHGGAGKYCWYQAELAIGELVTILFDSSVAEASNSAY